MKTCGYCGNEYEDRESKCPQCGSTLLKHMKGTESAAEEYERIKSETERKRKIRSIILIGSVVAIILAIILIISGLVGLMNDPQRAIARESKKLLNQAEEMIDNGEYDSAMVVLDQINTGWEDYSKTDAVRQKAERGILMKEIGEYKEVGDFEGLIVYISENVLNFEKDAEICAIYEEAAQKHKEDVLKNTAAYTEAKD